IVQEWNGYKPNIRWLLEGLWEHLIQLRNNEISARIQFEIKHPYDVSPRPSQWNNRIDWIESLYRLALDDFREYCTVFIFVPYFINIRKLSRLEAYDLVMNWLDRCRSMKRLMWNPRLKVNGALKGLEDTYLHHEMN